MASTILKMPVLGSSYVARSSNADDNRMVNTFPEMVPEGGKEPAFLNRAPGLRLVGTIGNGPIRGLWQFYSATAQKQIGYAVSGGELYSFVPSADNTSLTSTFLGNASGSGPVSMADNGTQLFIACNPNGYIYNAGTGAFAQITDPDFPGAQIVGYLDGYFVFTDPNTQQFWLTALLDGTSIDPLDFASAEGFPDLVVGMIIDHREIVLLGQTTVEVWYDSGAVDFPMARIDGAFNEVGCIAPYSVAKMDNQVYWLGQDARGFGVVYRLNGYIAQRVSTHAVEWRIQQYTNLADAIGYTFQMEGHTFYRLIFPDQQTGWQFDTATGSWTEFAGWDTTTGNWVRHRSNCQVSFNNANFVGDYVNGNIYALDLETYDDNGSPQRWLRSWRAIPTGQNNLTRSAQHMLQLDCESGVGLNSGQGSDPQVMLRWSDDGGHTWSNEHWASMGKIGKTGQRVIWRRLGMTQKLRDRVYEVSGTDPVKIVINGASVLISGTSA